MSRAEASTQTPQDPLSDIANTSKVYRFSLRNALLWASESLYFDLFHKIEHPSGATNFQMLEEPIILGAIDPASALQIQRCHPLSVCHR